MAQDELIRAIAIAGRDQQFREATFDALRRAESVAKDPNNYRTEVRWPLISALLADARYHQVELSNGLKYEIGTDSRIEQALLLSREAAPDHVWEPQTTRLLVMLAARAGDVLVGGAYIGDQVVPIARAVAARSSTSRVHAFEPMAYSFGRLVRNVQLNGFTNVVVNRAGLWDKPGTLNLSGEPALSTTEEASGTTTGESVPAIAADDYVRENGIESIGLIMLDTEGGEEKALRGSRGILSSPSGKAPNLVFEVHRHNVDWSNGLTRTPILGFLADLGYTTYAVRDFHDNIDTAGLPIEMIPADRVYLEGPPHGFNMFATKDTGAIEKYGIQLVNDVSPKLLLGKNPALHAPTAWLKGAANA